MIQLDEKLILLFYNKSADKIDYGLFSLKDMLPMIRSIKELKWDFYIVPHKDTDGAKEFFKTKGWVSSYE